ncbi:MAG: tetratricopeptide repeat protein [Reyranella sp.]|nr:tetratricopeptide repeat protein [Reyranella sp.]
MMFRRLVLVALLALGLASPGAGQGLSPFESTPDHLLRYTECMKLARREPLRALPMAEKWNAEGGGLGARHCVAVAMFQAGKYSQAGAQFEAIARDMGQDRPGLRAELWAQAGQAWLEGGQAEKAAEAQSRALDLKSNDADLWIDRALSYAAMSQWPRAISDLDQALRLRPDDVELLVLRAAAWRNARKPSQAMADVVRALRIAPDHTEALLERGFINLAQGNRGQANDDFNRVLRIVPPGSDAARRAQAGLDGQQPAAVTPPAATGTPPAPNAPPKSGGKR